MILTIFYVLTYALIAAGFIGCVVFIVDYRPFDLRSHGPAGRHLLVMSWSLAALFGLTLLFAIVPVPLWVARGVSVAVVAAIVLAVWQRVFLRRRAKRGHFTQE